MSQDTKSVIKDRWAHFLSKVDIGGADECWLNRWSSASAYGKFWDGTRVVPPNRYSWIHHNGPIPGDLCVCHRCNRKKCVNPRHLYLATRTENSRHALRDGLYRVTERTYACKLTTEQVLAIYARRHEPHIALSREFGVSHGAIYAIATGRTWSRVTGAPKFARPDQSPYTKSPLSPFTPN